MQIQFTVNFDADAWKAATADERTAWIHEVEDSINEHAYVSNRLVVSNADDEGHAPPLKDWWVDGHYITAGTAVGARAEAARIFDYTPEVVRSWTAEDQAELDFQIEAQSRPLPEN
jgi:hypothetical protein